MEDSKSTFEERIDAYFGSGDESNSSLRDVLAENGGLDAVRDFRLLRILSLDNKISTSSSRPDEAELMSFWNEQLPQSRMREIETHLACDPKLFDEYLNFRMDAYTPEELPSDDVSRDTLNMLLKSATSPHKRTVPDAPARALSNHPLNWLKSLINKFIPSRGSYWASGFALACVVLILFGVVNKPGDHSDLLFLIADTPETRARLQFRGASSRAIDLGTDEKFKSITISLNSKLRKALVDYSKTPQAANLEAILDIVRSEIKNSDLNPNQAHSTLQSLGAELYSGIQIEPDLWDRISSNSADSQIVRIETRSIPTGLKIEKSHLSLVLYFARF